MFPGPLSTRMPSPHPHPGHPQPLPDICHQGASRVVGLHAGDPDRASSPQAAPLARPHGSGGSRGAPRVSRPRLVRGARMPGTPRRSSSDRGEGVGTAGGGVARSSDKLVPPEAFRGGGGSRSRAGSRQAPGRRRPRAAHGALAERAGVRTLWVSPTRTVPHRAHPRPEHVDAQAEPGEAGRVSSWAFLSTRLCFRYQDGVGTVLIGRLLCLPPAPHPRWVAAACVLRGPGEPSIIKQAQTQCVRGAAELLPVRPASP